MGICLKFTTEMDTQKSITVIITKKENGLLTYYIRFGVCSGEHCIPYDLIREFEITR